MASEEPLFDPSLKKKKKKKAVAFSEDPLGADADPTTPAPPLEDDDAPKTVHQQMKHAWPVKRCRIKRERTTATVDAGPIGSIAPTAITHSRRDGMENERQCTVPFIVYT